MHQSHLHRPLAFLLVASVAFACERGGTSDLNGDGTSALRQIDPAMVRSTAKSTARAHLDGLVDALSLVLQGPVFESVPVSACGGAMTVPVDPEEEPPPDAPPVVPEEDDGCTASDIELADSEDIRQEVEEIVDFLFSDDNVEADSGTLVLFRLDPFDVCDGGADCINALTQVPIRFAVTSEAEGQLSIGLLVGEPAVIPLQLLLFSDRVALWADLAAAHTSALLFESAIGEPLPEEFPDSAQGVAQLDLIAFGERDYELTLSIDEAIDVSGGASAYALTIAESTTPVASVRFDGDSGDLRATANFGPVTAALPASVALDADLEGTLSVILGGLNGVASLDDAREVLSIASLGLGDQTSQILFDGLPLFSLDVNPTYNRRFDLTVAGTDQGTLVSFAPALELLASMSLSPLDPTAFERPAWAESETFSVSFTGSAAPTLLFRDLAPRVAEIGPDGQPVDPEPIEPLPYAILEVMSGVLELSSGSGSAVTVNATECMYADEDAPEDAHPFSVLSADMCVD